MAGGAVNQLRVTQSTDAAMDGILREFEKLEKKQINKPLISSVDRITQLLEETKRRIQNGPLCPVSTTAEMSDV